MSVLSLPSLPRRTVRDAARRAAQAAAGAVATWLVLRPLPLDEYFVGILAAVLILTPSADGTFRAAGTRLQATAVGCVVGVACLALLPPGWGAFAGLALSMAILSAAATVRPDWTYGIVAAVSLATTRSEAVWLAALDRIASIGVGAAIGLGVAALLWPDRARPRFDRHMGDALNALADMAGEATAKAAEADPDAALPAADRASDALSRAREAVAVLRPTEADAPRARIEAAGAMRRAIQILHSATAAPGDLWHDGLGDALDDFRAALSDALRALPDTDGPQGDGPVRRAERAVTERVEAARVADARTATVLAFAMDEVDRALHDCREAWA